MKQLILYIIFLMSMVFSGYGEVSAASVSLSHQDSLTVEATDAAHKKDGSYATEAGHTTKDRLAKVTPHQQEQDAQLEDASNAAYRVCSSRPQRLLPSGNMHGNQSASRLLSNRIHLLFTLLSAIDGAMEPFRQETAPIHFDVASKYYVICLRRLLC